MSRFKYKPISFYPELIKDWDYENNKSFSPDVLTAGSSKMVSWRCSICGHQWIVSPNSRRKGGCPKCDDKNRILRYKDECNRITTNQIASEIKYISVVIKRSSNLFLSNYTKGYISYLEERARKLESQWKNSTDRFFDVVRAVPMLIKRCTK